jgi:hypothetical protein
MMQDPFCSLEWDYHAGRRLWSAYELKEGEGSEVQFQTVEQYAWPCITHPETSHEMPTTERERYGGSMCQSDPSITLKTYNRLSLMELIEGSSEKERAVTVVVVVHAVFVLVATLFIFFLVRAINI